MIACGGTVLEEFDRLKPPMGVVYRKGGEGFEISADFPQPSMLFVQCHSIMRADVRPGRVRLDLDAYSTLLLPANAFARVQAVSAASSLAILIPSDGLMKKTAALYGLPKDAFSKLFSSKLRLTRTNWINEIMHRYVFERVEAGAADNEATAFLECELLKEVYYLSLARDRYLKDVFDFSECSGLDRKNPLLKRALAYIERDLFHSITMAGLAASCFASKATLLRTFRKAYAKTPFDYIRDRRLDESLALLKNGKYSVGEVAAMVGYENDSAFIAAFKRRFQYTPSRAASSGR